MGLTDGLKEHYGMTNSNRGGRPMLSAEKKEQVWNFWHENSTASTLTRSAKLRTTERQPIQENLMFKESVIVTKSRNIEYFTSKWFVTHKSVRELYNKYTTSHPDLPVSLGSFLTLKPFYIRQTTTKDIEMCVCKSHLHARWSVKAVKWQSSR